MESQSASTSEQDSDTQSQLQHFDVPSQRLRVGVAQLPLSRVKNIIKSDPDTTLASQEAVLIIAKATELFVGYLARKSHVFTVQGKRKTIQRRDIDSCIPLHDDLAFLEGTLDD